MKKKPEVRDFFVGTYPINAYLDPWDFVVDKYDIGKVMKWTYSR